MEFGGRVNRNIINWSWVYSGPPPPPPPPPLHLLLLCLHPPPPQFTALINNSSLSHPEASRKDGLG
eukprot:3329584-Pyramimonas_sp.AAC.1